jgi:hypothetical protein
LVGPKLAKLILNGVSDQDIVNIAEIFEKYVTAADRQSFISDLQKYAGLKSAIQSLTQDLDTLRKEIALLKTQKEDLHHDYQKILSKSVHSRQAVNFLQGSVFSLRNDIMALALIWAFIIFLLKSQVQDTHESQPHQSVEFEAFSKTIKGNEAIPVKDIKKAVAKAIKVLLSRPDADDNLTPDLFDAYAALTN